MAVRYGANQALALGAAAMQARHVCLGPGLVDEDELGWIKGGLIALPSQARGGHVRPVLLGGVHSFFSADPMALEEPPDRSDGRLYALFVQPAADVRKVRSGCSFTNAKIQAA